MVRGLEKDLGGSNLHSANLLGNPGPVTHSEPNLPQRVVLVGVKLK